MGCQVQICLLTIDVSRNLICVENMGCPCSYLQLKYGG